MIRSTIVEDDAKHSNRLQKLLAAASQFVEVKAVDTNVNDAIEAINKHKPELVFLDIRLHGDDKGGFELFRRMNDITFDVIFTTAHIDENIVEIRRCGLHYLIKPYVLSEVEDVLRKYDEKQKVPERQLKTLQSNLSAGNIADKVIYLNFDGSLYPIFVREILYCFSNNVIITLVIKTANEELYSTNIRRHSITTKKTEHDNLIEWERHMTMKTLEADFSDLNFCRIHNEYLVNMMHVKKFFNGENGGGKVKLSNNEILDVSAAGKKEFLRKTGRR